MASDFDNIELKIQNIVNHVSLFAALLTSCILVGLGLFKYQLIDRVSLRFQGFIALIDIIRHLSHFKESHENDTVCQAIAYFIFFTDHLYLLFNIAIALNIQLMLIQNKRPHKRLQWIYGSISVILALVINSIPLIAKRYGRNRADRCRLLDDKSSIWWNVLLVYITNFPGTIYCLVIFILVVLQLRRKKQEIRLIRGTEEHFGPDPLRFVWTLYYRISLYPLSCFITLFPFTFSRIFLDATGAVPLTLSILYRFCRRITGTLNFVTMICDPHCQIALKFLWQSLFSIKAPQNTSTDIELPSLQPENISSTPCEHELEYSNGDRIQLREYIRYL